MPKMERHADRERERESEGECENADTPRDRQIDDDEQGKEGEK